jgi:hypothetical protein
MIDGILYYIYSNDLFNNNQYGFTAQRGTIDAVMEVKNFIEESLRFEQCTIIVGLDVTGAFDSAWWPCVLMQLRDLKCPKNLYNLSANYFSNRKATLSINIYRTEKEIQKGCPQGSCCGPGYWNAMYSSLLNLKFISRTKVIAFADDLFVLTRGACKMETENYANQDLKKIERWVSDNKIEFNDKDPRFYLYQGKKRRQGS